MYIADLVRNIATLPVRIKLKVIPFYFDDEQDRSAKLETKT